MSHPEEGVPPHARLVELSMSVLLAKALYAVTEREIPDRLAAGPRSSAELAEAAGVQPGALHQVLRALSGIGVFTEDADGRFALTPVGATLQEGHPSAAREFVLMFGGPAVWQALGVFSEVLATGHTGMELAHGMPFFDYLQKHPDEGAAFNRMMLAVHGTEPAAVAEAYDFSGVRRLVDVGGGIGTMLVNVLGRHRHLAGVLFDMPSVVDQGRAVIADAGLTDRCDFVTGDFFDSVPSGGDAYLLSHIIHDWGEDDCLRILGNCRQAMGPDGRLLLVEMVLPPGDEPHPGKMLDLAMLCLVGGQERTAAEYGELLGRAGFRLERVVPTNSPVSVVEAVPDAAG
jgi:hypothetical protein